MLWLLKHDISFGRFSFFGGRILACLDSDPYLIPNLDPMTQLNPDPKHRFGDYEDNFFLEGPLVVLDTISNNKYGTNMG
jgi:hypothetical protein